jgi:hypothetical protein
MIKAVALVLSVTIVSGSQPTPRRVLSMQELTVPSERLPAGCALAPSASIDADGHHVRGGWSEFPTNPWIGTDPRLIASIRQLLDGPAAVPDGPPLDAKALSRYLAQLADGVEEAYGVTYMQSDAGLITVRALRFSPGDPSAGRSTDGDTRGSRNPAMIRVALGTIVAIVTGASGACFQDVATYLKSLAN